MSLDIYSSYMKTGNVGSDGGWSYSFYYLQLFMVNYFKCIRDVATLVYIHEIYSNQNLAIFWEVKTAKWRKK
jgi:hypothetical protein